jgi:ABC-type methionine transport system ATPase subunit
MVIGVLEYPSGHGVPDEVRFHCMACVDVILIAGKDQVNQPWLWKLSREFNVQVNIKKANVDTDYGWIQIEFQGAVEEIQRATAWLMTTGMHVEASERALGA